MRKKQLRYSTIIPPHLYVRREADRKLRDVLDDMGGPGYVLVARQMGKTNLLLNAKNELESLDTVFVYIDLSNSFSTVNEYFRNIIDTAIDTHSGLFTAIVPAIKQNRAQQLLPHKEHDIELRFLLGQVKEKLVIILDEIDALTNTEFSDQVFAQIRSTYFAGRTNYPEFKKLTYILSGVAEPTEIIKNPKLSPFNIGQKIYLDDFTLNEYAEFLEKAGLPLEAAISDRIFYWAGGNPRITWEVCSAIEDILIAGQRLTEEQVDATIEKLYLRQFDRPPVDHIRDIVEHDKELRNAITEIRYGKGHEINHAIRTKLYLAGIVRHDESGAIEIKNNIIGKALSEQWLISIEKKISGVFSIAQERYTQQRYQESIELCEEYLSSSNLTKDDASIVHFLIGTASYRLGNFRKAAEALEKCEFDKRKSVIYFRETRIHIGLCSLFLGERERAVQLFGELIDTTREQRDKVYYQALFSRAVASEVVSDLEKLLEDITADESHLDSLYVYETKITSYYNLFLIYRRRQDLPAAKNSLAAAIELSLTSMPRFAPFLLSEAYDNETDQAQRKSIIEKACTVIVERGLAPTGHNMWSAPMEFREATFLRILVLTYAEEMQECLRMLMQVAARMNPQWRSPAQLYYMLATTAFELGFRSVASSVFRRLCDKAVDGEIDEQTLFGAHRYFLNLETMDAEQFLYYFRAYFELFKRVARSDQIRQSDFDAIAHALTILLRLGRLTEIDDVLRMLDRHRRTLESKGEDIPFVLLDYIALLSFKQREDNVQEFFVAKRIIDGLAKARDANRVIRLPAIGDTQQSAALKTIEEGTKESYWKLRSHPSIAHMFPVVPKIGRNSMVTVKYQDGSIRIGVKYKKIEEDLKQGLCTIVPD